MSNHNNPRSLSETKTLAAGDNEHTAHIQGVTEEPFFDGPPCLQVLHRDGIRQGERNNAMFNVGVYMKLKYPGEWQDRLSMYNDEKCDPPLKASELAQLIKSLDKRDYAYTCGQGPIDRLCNAKACRKRPYGIGTFARREREKKMPEFGQLTEYLTDPPRWVLPVNGKDIELSTDELMNLEALRKAVVANCLVMLPRMGKQEWDAWFNGLLSDSKAVDVPTDAGTLGLFRSHLRDFLRRCRRREKPSRDDVLMGNPYEEDGRVWFRSTDLRLMLTKRRFFHYDGPKLWMVLRAMDVTTDKWTLKGATVPVWSLSVSVLEDEAGSDILSASTGEHN